MDSRDIPMNGAEPLFRLWVPRNGIEWITSNSAKGKHWGAVKRLRDDWKHATWAAAAQSGLSKGYPPAVLDSAFYFPTNRRRDPLNFADTLKPIVDFLIKECQCWPDDNPRWLIQNAPTCEFSTTLDGVLLLAYDRTEETS